VSSDPSSWKEARPPHTPGPIYGFRRGYRADRAGKPENDKQFRAFLVYMNLGAARSYAAAGEVAGYAEGTVREWAETYEWQRRAAAWDKDQMKIIFRDANKLERRKHRQNSEKFREATEEQAKLMMGVSNDLMAIFQKRFEKA
jgi:hypothetical protein